MLYTYFTKELLGLEDVIVNNIIQNENSTEIYIEMPIKEHACPCCNMQTKQIHNYRMQQIKDIPAFGKNIYIHLRKRRYRCTHCGKRFYEKVSFLPHYHRMTSRLAAFVIHSLRSECSFTSVARSLNLSVSTVIRIFDIVCFGKPKLPKVLAIDEFKGNTSGEKYQCIITDPINHIVLDILPKRYASYLTQYFKDLNRNDVDFFVSDMWKSYTDFATVFFKNATQIVDKYHFISQVVWEFEAVRKEEQKQQVNVMLYASSAISSAHFFKGNVL